MAQYNKKNIYSIIDREKLQFSKGAEMKNDIRTIGKPYYLY